MSTRCDLKAPQRVKNTGYISTSFLVNKIFMLINYDKLVGKNPRQGSGLLKTANSRNLTDKNDFSDIEVMVLKLGII